MRKGFTLIELIIVIIIIGILATLGFAQYVRMIERARGAEARSVLGAIRTQAATLWIEMNTGGAAPAMPTANEFTNARVGIGNNPGQIALACNTNYYFSYNLTATNLYGFTAEATRCTAGGKPPQGPGATTLTLTTNFSDGTDIWGGTGGY